MIDTVILMLTHNLFNLLDIVVFDGHRDSGVRGRYVANNLYPCTLAERKRRERLYFPAVTLKNNKTCPVIEIQVSLPKLVYGNSFFEVSKADLNIICNRLVECLAECHVVSTKDQIRQAVIKQIDFCKNIRFEHYFGTPIQIIRKLSEFDCKRSSKWQVVIHSHGIEYKLFNTTQKIVVYDKLGEISNRVRTNKNFTKDERKLVEELDKRKHYANIVRVELSLMNKQSLDAFLSKRVEGEKKKNFTLEDVMKKELARNILLEKVNEIYKPEYVTTLTLAEMKENEMEAYLLGKNMTLSQHECLSYWINKVAKIGIKNALDELRCRTSNTSYHARKKKIKDVCGQVGEIGGYTSNLANFIKGEVKDFELLRPNE